MRFLSLLCFLSALLCHRVSEAFSYNIFTLSEAPSVSSGINTIFSSLSPTFTDKLLTATNSSQIGYANSPGSSTALNYPGLSARVFAISSPLVYVGIDGNPSGDGPYGFFSFSSTDPSATPISFGQGTIPAHIIGSAIALNYLYVICQTPMGGTPIYPIYVYNLNNLAQAPITISTPQAPRAIVSDSSGTTPLIYVVTSDLAGTSEVYSINTTAPFTLSSLFSVAADSPLAIAPSPDGTTLCTLNSPANTVSIAKANVVVATVSVIDSPSSIAFNSDSSKAYVIGNSSTISEILLSAPYTVTPITTLYSDPLVSFTLVPPGGGASNTIYAVDGIESHSVQVINTTTRTASAVPLSTPTDGAFTSVTGSTDAQTVYVSFQGTDVLIVYSIITGMGFGFPSFTSSTLTNPVFLFTVGNTPTSTAWTSFNQ